ncbi:glycosyltransferase family 4 protein [Candidatus Uhrbacteria bacterium]|nr:glycosyltransferase family 4 protein [Candidatus Uhrbacteria bacterium]
MKIAFIGQKAIPFYRDGGVERHVEELSTRLAKRGHEVTVFVRKRYVATKDDMWNGVKLTRVPEIPTKHLGTISSTLCSTLYALRSRYDIIHFHGVGPALLSWIPRLFTRAKIVVTFHSIDRFHAKWGFWARFVLRIGEWCATHIPHTTIGVSHSIVRYCRQAYKKNVHYIPNAVEIHKMESSAALKQWGLQKNGYLVTVARLIKHKGIHYLIEAYRQVPEEVKGEMKLVIVGAPSFTADYSAYLKQLAAADHRIIFTGYQTGDELKQLYAHAYFYVHPSESEGLSLTILEAMSFGKCVLISNIPENLEAIDHSGVPFAVGNVSDLAEKIVGLINHPEIVREKGKLALGFIKRYFDWDKVVAETEKLYTSLVDKGVL